MGIEELIEDFKQLDIIEQHKLVNMLNRYLTQGETSIVGYTTGVFDLFHIGHLNILKRAKDCCDELIVGITTDELTEKLKGNKPIIPFVERAEIISSIKYVDTVIPQRDINELKDFEKLKFKVIFKGGDWKGTDKWNKLEPEFNKRGVKVIFFPYTKSTSSTKLRELINKKII